MLAFFDGGGEDGDQPCSPAGGGHEGFPARLCGKQGQKAPSTTLGRGGRRSLAHNPTTELFCP